MQNDSGHTYFLCDYRVSDACDVETFKEFKALAEEIIDKKPRKDLTLTVEMTSIEKGTKKVSSTSLNDIVHL